MVVSPFGEILGSLGSEEETLVVDLDLDEVVRAREAIPVLHNRRQID
jgi:predicted amidohydrolase